MHLGSYAIDDLLTFTCNTHNPSTGEAIDADAAPTYRIYEDETSTPVLTGTMSVLDDDNTTGFYSEQITLSAANGFEAGKCYTIRIAATVGGVTGVTERTFQIGAKVTGSGARTVTVTVTDGTDPLENAAVRMTMGVTSLVQQTDENGQCTFNLDDGDWRLAVSLAGYSYGGSTVTVDDDAAIDVEMTQVTVPLAGEPALTTGYIYCYDSAGELASGVEIEIECLAGPGADAQAISGATITATSDVNGLATATLWRGGQYRARRGTGRWYHFTAANAALTPLPEVLGRD